MTENTENTDGLDPTEKDLIMNTLKEYHEQSVECRFCQYPI